LNYHGKYGFFNAREIKTYPLKTRSNKVKQNNLLLPEMAMSDCEQLPAKLIDKKSLFGRHRPVQAETMPEPV